MIDQSQVVAGVLGSGGLRREVLIRTAATNRIGGTRSSTTPIWPTPGCHERQLQDGGGTGRSPWAQIADYFTDQDGQPDG